MEFSHCAPERLNTYSLSCFMPCASRRIFGRRQGIEMRVLRGFATKGLRRIGFQLLMTDLMQGSVLFWQFRPLAFRNFCWFLLSTNLTATLVTRRRRRRRLPPAAHPPAVAASVEAYQSARRNQ